MTRAVHVAVLSWRDTTHPDGGGSEVFVEQVARRLVARGHRVTVVCARHDGSAAHDVLDGVRVVRRGGRLSVYPWGLLWLLRHRREVDVVVDVINGLPFGSPLVRRRGVVALVHHLHDAQWRLIYPGLRGRVGWLVESRLVPWLYRSVPVLTVSEASRRDLVALGFPAAAVSVAHNAVERPRADVSKSPTPRLVVLARLVPHKRIEHAFDLVHRLAVDHPDVHLDVVGEGWWRPELEARLAEPALRRRVTLHGWLNDDDRDAVLARAWLLVLPSLREGWGIAVLEAAAQGTPALGYRGAGGVEEAIRHDVTGLLAHDRDDGADLLAQAARVLADRALRERLGSAARERAGDHDWEDTAAEVEAVLAAAATGRRR